MYTLKERQEHLDKTIAHYQRVRETIPKLYNQSGDGLHPAISCASWLAVNDEYITIEAKATTSNLCQLRRGLRVIFRNWNDVHKITFLSDVMGDVNAVFVGTMEGHEFIQIRLCAMPEEFPKAFMPSPDCHIEEYPAVNKRLVCPVGGGS